jgi:hypothetical protein
MMPIQLKRVSTNMKCRKRLSEAINIGEAFVESGEWDGKNYELEATVHRYLCLNTECGKEFFF